MTTLDRLRQPHPGREHQGRTPPLSRRLRVPIDLTNRPSIDRPSITDPDHAPPARCALAGLRHHLRRDLILRSPTSPQNESPGPGSNIPNAGPPRPPRRLDLQPPDTFLTNDQKASTSTSLICRSWTRASACWAAIRSHRPMVSYLWPVISSAALKLPRRITTSRVRATSAGVTRKRYIAVPRVTSARSSDRPNGAAHPYCRSLPHGWPHSEGRGFWELIHRDHLRRNLAPIILPSTTQGSDWECSSQSDINSDSPRRYLG
jgi:hypothetical protein